MVVNFLAGDAQFLRLSRCARQIDLRPRHRLPGLLILLIRDAVGEIRRRLHVSPARLRILLLLLANDLLLLLVLMQLLYKLTLVHVLRVLLREPRALMVILVLVQQLLSALKALTRRRHRVTHLMLLHGQTVRFLHLRALPLQASKRYQSVIPLNERSLVR